MLFLLACSDYTVQGEEKPATPFDTGGTFTAPIDDTATTTTPPDTATVVDTADTVDTDNPCAWATWHPDTDCDAWPGTAVDGDTTLDGPFAPPTTTLTADSAGTTLTVADPAGLAADHELFLLGPDGSYAFARVVSVWGTVEVSTAVSFPAGSRVQRVPHYGNVTVGAVTGSVLAFRACGGVTVDTALSARGGGHPGGPGTTGIPELGWQGTGDTGPGAHANLANGTGGGGGADSCNVHADGGGGGHATPGANGPTYSYPCAGPGGDGGGTTGDPALTTLHFGGGGGSGYLDNDASPGSIGGAGGAGGGIVYLVARDGVWGAGTVDADGAAGTDGLWIGAASPGGGGGGAGGSVRIFGDVAVPLSAVGGAGGIGSEAGAGTTVAGAGGEGRVRVDGVLSATSMPAAYAECP